MPVDPANAEATLLATLQEHLGAAGVTFRSAMWIVTAMST